MIDVRVSGGSLAVRFDSSVLVVLLWVTAFSLMLWHTFAGSALSGRWAILCGIAAGTWTVARVVNHARRVICEVMSYEFRVRDEVEPEPRGQVRRL